MIACDCLSFDFLSTRREWRRALSSDHIAEVQAQAANDGLVYTMAINDEVDYFTNFSEENSELIDPNPIPNYFRMLLPRILLLPTIK